MDNLESKEKEKYNHLVLKHNYGNDYDRKSQIKKIEERLGTVSTLYADILTDLMKGREEGIAEFKALDIGSGPGGVMDWLEHEYNADVYGIDISDAFVERSIDRYEKFTDKIHVGNAKDMHMFATNSFDLVQHLDGMEHIPMEWEEDVLKEAVRVSRKYIFYETACEDSLADRWLKEDGFGPAHINLKTPEEWQQFFETHAKEFNYDILETCSNFSTEETIHAIILEKIND